MENSGNSSQLEKISATYLSEKSLTCREAAAFLAMSARTLETWRSRKKGPAFIRQCGAIRYKMHDLIAFQEANRSRAEKEHDLKGQE